MRCMEELGNFILNEITEQKNKKPVVSGINEVDGNLAIGIGHVLKTYASQIERMLPVPWKLAGPLKLDKKAIAKNKSAYMDADLIADWEYPISNDMSTKSSAYFVIGFYSYGGGAGVVCGVLVSAFDPDCRDTSAGVSASPIPKKGEIDIDVEWKRKNKEFEPTKDVFPMIKDVMKKLKVLMPEYEEYYED